MKYARILRLMPDERRKQTQKVIDTLKIGGRSEKTTANYVHAIDRFLKYFYDKDIEKLNEPDIIEYTKSKYLNNNCAGSTYNLNISAIKYFYAINFNKEFSTKLLPHAKLTKKIPITLDKEIFLKILNEEKNLKHKCWLLLAFCSGLRAEEVASVRIKDIYSKELNHLEFLNLSKCSSSNPLINFFLPYIPPLIIILNISISYKNIFFYFY